MNQSQNVSQILAKLVSIPTPSSISNMPLLEWVADYLKPFGWQAEILSYCDESGVAKANLVARPKSVSAQRLIDLAPIDLAFICHTDTVPFKADWVDALNLVERGANLHGCGACDVKGSLACFLSAVSSLSEHKVDPATALILTADEEIGCKGMDRLLEQLAAKKEFRIKSAIISEPTSLRAGIAGKGYGLARVVIEGREAHSAFPAHGVSAISIAARMISLLEDRFNAAQSKANESGLFEPPRTTLNIGVIEGGTAKNIVPGSCTFLVEWRSLPDQDPTTYLNQVLSIAREIEHLNPAAAVHVQPLRNESGFMPPLTRAAKSDEVTEHPVQGKLQERLARLLPHSPTGISFGSEAGRVSRIADEVIVIGPGDMRTAHSDRECVPINELDLWSRTLRELLSIH